MNIRSLALVSILAALSFPAYAQSIPVENSSFELTDLGHDTSTTERFSVTAPPAWSATGSGGTGIGVDDPVDSMYSGSNGPVLPGTADGAQYGYMNLPAGFSNNFLYSGSSLGTFVAGQTYTLTVALGGRNDGGLRADVFSISMLAGGSLVGTGASSSGIANTFFDLSYSFTATPAEDGQLIGIQLFASNTGGGFEQANFDNVRLSVLPVPEPSSVALLMLAGVSILVSRWPRRNRR